MCIIKIYFERYITSEVILITLFIAQSCFPNGNTSIQRVDLLACVATARSYLGRNGLTKMAILKEMRDVVSSNDYLSLIFPFGYAG